MPKTGGGGRRGSCAPEALAVATGHRRHSPRKSSCLGTHVTIGFIGACSSRRRSRAAIATYEDVRKAARVPARIRSNRRPRGVLISHLDSHHPLDAGDAAARWPRSAARGAAETLRAEPTNGQAQRDSRDMQWLGRASERRSAAPLTHLEESCGATARSAADPRTSGPARRVTAGNISGARCRRAAGER